MILEKYNLDLKQIKKLARLGKKMTNKNVNLPTRKEIQDAMKYIKLLSGNYYVHSQYARNLLMVLTMPNLQVDKLLKAIQNNKRIYINSFI